MNYDRLFGPVNPTLLREATYKTLSKLQGAPEMMVLAVAVLLVSLCDALNVDIKRLIESVERRKRDLDGPFVTTFRALEDYARNEIGR